LRVLVLAAAVLALGACGYPDPTPASGAVATEINASPSPSECGDFNAGAGQKPIKLPDGLQYIDLKAGTGPVALKGAKVSMQYTGWLLEGRKFDSSCDRNQPFSFTIGNGEVIPGWDEGIPGMKAGGERKLIIPPALGYGDQGSPPTIPGGATLVFVVTLVDVTPPATPSPGASPTSSP
jgi:FKBP-type peptidyl-prolyl cis-trans isomerase FkpA